jgi:hypothetical protein
MIEREFKKYLTSVYPMGVPPQQEAEVRQAFFAGAAVAMCEIGVAADAGDRNGVRVLKELDRELAEYVALRAAQLKNPARS